MPGSTAAALKVLSERQIEDFARGTAELALRFSPRQPQNSGMGARAQIERGE